MANDQHIPHYSAADIERYQQGRLSAAEMHAMEKASLEDPFLADALEGYALAGPSMQADVAELHARLQARESEARVIPLAAVTRKSYTWLKVAAMAVIIFGAAFLVYRLGFDKRDPGIAYQSAEKKPASSPVAPPGADTAMARLEASPDKDGGTSSPIAGDMAKQGNGQVVAEPVVPALQSIVPGVKTKRNDTVNQDGVSDQAVATLQADAAAPVNAELQEEIILKKAQAKKTEEEKDKMVMGMASRKNNSSTDNSNSRQMQFMPNIFRGRVLDANNNALPFANIINAQDNIGTYTDARGNFVLTSPDTTLDVRVRSLGFESQAVELKPNAQLIENKIVLAEADNVSAVVISRQKVNAARPRTSTMVLEEPEPIDGWTNYDTYIANNLQVPQTDRSRPQQTGEVELSFEVDKKGEPVNIAVVRSLCESCDKEAIRLLKDGPKWKRKAKAARTSLTIAF